MYTITFPYVQVHSNLTQSFVCEEIDINIIKRIIQQNNKYSEMSLSVKRVKR